MLSISFEPDEAFPTAAHLYEADPRTYNRLMDTLELIAADPEEGKQRAEYVSTRKVWASYIRGTRYTAYWRTTEANVLVVYLLRE